MVDDRLLQRPGGEKHPAIVVGPLIIGWRQACLGKCIREVGADGRGLGDNPPVVNQRRDLAHRIDGQVLLGLHGRAVFEQHLLVGLAHFLQHPPGNLAPGHGIGIEN